MKFECVHVDTCLSDYWGGHHLPHVQIAVWHGMTLREIKQAIRDELAQGAVAGSDDNASLLSADWVGDDRDKDARKTFAAAVAAVNRIKPARKYQKRFFTNLEKDVDGDHDTVWAFFVFREY